MFSSPHLRLSTHHLILSIHTRTYSSANGRDKFHRLLRQYRIMTDFTPTEERKEELHKSLEEIRKRVRQAAPDSSATLVAVSKFKPSSDIKACYESGQLDFGENYVQELQDKASVLPEDIRWHFIGNLQSNKAKTIASIPNMCCVQTVSTQKLATALQKNIPAARTTPLRVLIQVNTSGEDNKSGIPPLDPETNLAESELIQLATHILKECPKLRLEGLMTIGSLEQSLMASETEKNADFEKLKETRDILQLYLASQFGNSNDVVWGQENRKLALSMGMSSDFEAALKAGSDIVRVGTGIFGARSNKGA